MRRMLLATTAIVTAAVFVGGDSQSAEAALTPTVTVTATSTGASWFNQALNVAKFDNNLGTLNSVIVSETFRATLHVNIAATAASITPLSSVSAHFEAPLTIGGGPVALNGAPLVTLATTATVGFASFTTPFNGVTAPATSSIPSSSFTTALGGWQAPGGGTFALALTSNPTLARLFPLPGYVVKVAPDLLFSVSVAYNYTAKPIPEPATMATLAVGLFGIGALRRRVSRKRSLAPYQGTEPDLRV